MHEYLDIENRQKDYEQIYSETFRMEKGIRAIGLMYHEHSSDQQSYENIFRMKDNIQYRLFSASHQYLILLRELKVQEERLQRIYKENPQYINPSSFPLGNPFFDQCETELSSVFDSIIFHLSSVFDYFSHTLCYIYFQNKESTLYWTKLSRKVRGDFKGKFKFCEAMDEVDRSFAGHLYDYRSRLLHMKRDKHKFDGTIKLDDLYFRLKILCSEATLKHFKSILNDKQEVKQKITLTYLSSWLIRQTFKNIEYILDSVKVDIETNSSYHENFTNLKGRKGQMRAIFIQATNSIKPISQMIWEEYKSTNTESPNS